MLLLCPTCQSGNPPKARFCQKCGAALTVLASTNTASETSAPPTSAPVASPAAPVASPETSSSPVASEVPPVVALPPPPVPVTAAPPVQATFSPAGPDLSKNLPLPDFSDDTPPVSIAFNFNRLFVTGHLTTAEVRLENICSHPLERIEVVLNSSGLGSPVTIRIARIAPAQSVVRLVEVDPARTGNMVLSCSLRLQTAGDVSNYRGERTFRVLQEPSQQNNFNIVVQDILNNSGTNAGLGADTGHVEISNLIGQGVIKDLNSLLEHEQEERFVILPLELDFSLSMRDLPTSTGKLRIPPTMLGCVQPASRLKLVPATPDGKLRELHLVARERFVFGRSRDEANFLTWFWPRSDKHDEATRHIGKAHAVATVQNASIVLSDNGSVNGSRLDGQPLSKDRGLPVTERGVLRVGNDYEIDIWHDVGSTKGRPVVANAVRWAGPAAGEPPTVTGSVRFTPRNTDLGPWNAIWLFTDAAFGRSKSNPVVLDLPGLAEIQGRFHYWRGAFWLELAHGDGRVAINSQPLTVGNFAPLVSGQQVELGEVVFRVEALP